ncbi:MAG: TRAP transporter small permease subunit [Clostridiales bacterium]|nr:TRAP transporter small permease subunit [Clostridiales bacterium]
MRKAIDLLAKIQIAVGALFLFIFMMTVVIQMACRYTGVAATWTEDVSMYSFIWAVFMGAGAMVHEKRHFAFTSISDMLKEGTVKRLLSMIICIIMLIFAFLMLKYGIAVTKQFWNYTWNNIPSFKRGPTWMCLPICGATSCIYLIEEIIDSLLALGKGGNN